MSEKYPSNSEIIYIRSIEDSIDKLISEGKASDGEELERYKYSMSRVRVKSYEKYFSPKRILYFQNNNIINPVYDSIEASRVEGAIESSPVDVKDESI